MKIANIRFIITSCNWVRHDLSGATESEFKSSNVPARLVPHIEQVRALVIAPRFTRDIENQAWAIQCAEKTIDRWNSLQ